MSLLSNSNAIESGGYQIQRSLRFRSSASAYLSRTPASASNRTTWTWSGWVKRGVLGSEQVLFSAGLVSPDKRCELYFTSGDALSLYTNSGTGSPDGDAAKQITTSQVFRDPSAWYHIVAAVDTTQTTASNRLKLYVNGVQVTALASSAYPSQNHVTAANGTVVHYLGRWVGPTLYYLDGYLSEINFIDGQAITPSSFGQTDPVTGVWQPKKYTGTYGTNGFYLDFKDNTSATTLAYDKSGNGNNWTPNNISTTAGATYDSMTDVPTLTSATAANYCVLNPLDGGANTTVSSGNLNYVTSSAGAYCTTRATMGVTSGKWYFEITANSTSGANVLGIANAAMNVNDGLGNNTNGWSYASDGNAYYNGAATSTGASWVNGDVLSVAFDADSGKLWFAKNGTWVLSGNPAAGTSPVYTGLTSNTFFPAVSDYGGATANLIANFGQRPFSYTPPTGFKALNTFNLPDPTIKKPNQYMDVSTYTSNGGAQTITNSGSMQPDLLWIKRRDSTGGNALVDSIRGVANFVVSSSTAAEATDVNYITAFNSNGFSLGSGNFANGATVVGWQWKKGATQGFDIVTYTGTGSARTVSHNLGVAPKMIIVKRRNNTAGWPVYHANMSATPQNGTLFLNATDAYAATTTFWSNTAPTSSVFTVDTSFNVNGSGDTYVAYLFAEIAGFSKFGSYTGNGSTDGPFVYCGFRPKYVMVKRSDSVASWYVLDSVRDTYNAVGNELMPNQTSGESTGNNDLDFTSNGFKWRVTATAYNASGGTYIYAAFAETPFRYSLAR